MESAGLCRKEERESRKAADFWSLSAPDTVCLSGIKLVWTKKHHATNRPMAPKQQNGSWITPEAALRNGS
jgi:hypothetical protein